MATVKEQLEALSVDDNLQRTEDPLATNWEKPPFSWLAGTGKATATGWATKANNEEIGALWTKEALTPTAWAVAATLGVNLSVNSGIFALWGAVSKTKARGLLMNVKRTGASACTLELIREGTTRETLKTQASVNLATGNTYYLTFFEGKLTGWLKKSGGSIEEILSVETTLPPESGEYSAMELFVGGSTTPRIINFATAPVEAEVAAAPRRLALLGVGR